jgi:hypothetical protein
MLGSTMRRAAGTLVDWVSNSENMPLERNGTVEDVWSWIIELTEVMDGELAVRLWVEGMYLGIGGLELLKGCNRLLWAVKNGIALLAELQGEVVVSRWVEACLVGAGGLAWLTEADSWILILRRGTSVQPDPDRVSDLETIRPPGMIVDSALTQHYSECRRW